MNSVPIRRLPDIPISYQTNKEYRHLFRVVTQMDTSKYYDNIQTLPNIDEETLDEYNYDEETVSTFMNYIVTLTIHHPLFQQLYDLAAAKMFSTDREIGIAILLSFDFLKYYYPLLTFYEMTPEKLNTENECYLHLLAILDGK